jgi:hypothetical protein
MMALLCWVIVLYCTGFFDMLSSFSFRFFVKSLCCSLPLYPMYILAIPTRIFLSYLICAQVAITCMYEK